MFLFKRGKYYHLEYSDEPNEPPKRISTGKKTKSEAIKFVSEFREKLSSKPKSNFISLSNFKDEYVCHVKSNLSKSYSRIVELSLRLLIEKFGDIPLGGLTYKQLDDFITESFSRTMEGTRTYYIALKSAFNKAILWEYLKENHLAKIKLPKIPEKNPRYIDDQEFIQTASYESDEILKDMYYVAYYTGLRRAEIANLEFPSLNFNERKIKVMNTESFLTKSRRARTVPMDEIVFLILQKRIPKVIELNNKNYVFTKGGVKLKEDFITKKFKACVRLSKIDKKFHFHDLRHCYATNKMKQGVPIYIISKLLGHKDTKTTEIYLHLKADDIGCELNNHAQQKEY